jgi:3-dehydroquinate synthase
MEILNVGLGDRSYPIWIGDGVLDQLPDMLAGAGFPTKIGVVTNPKVSALYAAKVMSLLAESGCQADLIEIPDGEEFKNLEVFNQVITVLIEKGYDRKSGLIALGGGVVGDLTGYVAASYLRGIPFIQIPTTLLSQVDSSVGGKTGVNHALGKNLIGAFYQPQGVLIDVQTLSTLESREFASGMAEVIKYGVIRDREFFNWLKLHCSDLVSLRENALVYAVQKSCQIKADIVENDEKEANLRAILNFGHTFGHAVENLAGYGVIKHGEAVSIGMVVAAGIAKLKGHCTTMDIAEIRNVLVQFGLPTEPPSFSLDDYLAAMSRDKKVLGGKLRLVLNTGIGDCLIEDEPDPRESFSEVL